MPNYLELKRKREARLSNVPTPTSMVEEEDDFILDPEASLKKDDLQRPQFAKRDT